MYSSKYSFWEQYFSCFQSLDIRELSLNEIYVLNTTYRQERALIEILNLQGKKSRLTWEVYALM